VQAGEDPAAIEVVIVEPELVLGLHLGVESAMAADDRYCRTLATID